MIIPSIDIENYWCLGSHSYNDVALSREVIITAIRVSRKSHFHLLFPYLLYFTPKMGVNSKVIKLRSNFRALSINNVKKNRKNYKSLQ